ncbi:hypothetical protein [Nocardioides sp. SYSU DS0651]|uniref:hypothetical protein n=1 Tax=Nocardioides sp. SYSU DS0651 TaxID=3415955 RepID=UPI003F4C3BA3
MQQPLTAEDQGPAEPVGRGRSFLAWWPIATGLVVGVFSVATDDPGSIDGVLLTLLIPTCAYALIALGGNSSWTWPLTGLVVVTYLAGEALSLPGAVILLGITVATVVGGTAAGRWRPPPAEMRWQPWGALVFLTGVITAMLLDVTAAKVVLAVGLLLHGAWDIVHWRRRAVVSRSLAEWCAALDISLGVGVLALVVFT